MKKKKIWIKILIAVLGVILIGAGVFFFVLKPKAQAMVQNSSSSIQYVTLEEGVLTSTIGATGKIESVQSSEIYWGTSGTVEEVGVVIGDTVSKGDILAALEKESMPEEYILAVEDYYDAKESLEDLQNSYDAVAIAEAEKNVADAKETLKDAEWNYSYLSSPADQSYIDDAYADLMIAKKQLVNAEAKWAEWENKSEENVDRAYVQQEYIAAKQNYDSKLAYYNNVSTPATDLDLEVAAAELKVAQEALAAAEESLADLQAGATDDEIAAAEAKVITAQQKMEKQFIEAPFDGTITESYPEVNDSVTSSTMAFRIDDISKMQIELSVSELDINDVEVGQKAVITFDSLVGQEFEGEVVSKGLVGSTVSSIVYYPVVVEINEPDSSIQIGMTATVDIYVESGEASVLVPNTAITVVNGEQVVYVKSDSMFGNMGNGAGIPAADDQTSTDDTTDDQSADLSDMQVGDTSDDTSTDVNFGGNMPTMSEYVAVAISVGLSSDDYSTIVEGNLSAGMQVVLDPSSLNATDEEDTSSSAGIFGMLFGGSAGGDMGGGRQNGSGQMPEGGPPSGDMPAGGPPGGN